jgi:6-phosphogluconolactonase
MGKYFMISLRHRFGLQMTSRALGMAQAFVLLGLMGLLAACGGGGGAGGGGGGGGGTPPPAVTLSSITVAAKGTGGATVVAGLTLQFTATGVYSDGTQKDLSTTVTWTSSDTSKAIISPAGLVTGVAAGPSTITATSTSVTAGSVAGQDALTVAPPNLLSVVISPNNPSVAVHRVVQFSAIGSYTDGTTKDLTTNVTWVSSDTTIASISSSGGLATAAAALGSTNIGATMTGGPTITSVQMVVTATIYAYATNFDDDTVSQYQLGPDGSLSPLSTAAVKSGHEPFSISVEPTGEYVYVSNWGASTVSQYRIGATGELSAIGDIPSGADPNGVTIDHADRFAYVANLGDSTVSQYTIGLDGRLMPMSKATVPSGPSPAALIVDPADHFAYVANFGANSHTPPPGPASISQYSMGSDGSLTAMSTATVVSDPGPNALAIDPSSKYLYVANMGDGSAGPNGTVGQYNINSDGSLTAMSTPSVPTGQRPVGITIDPTGHYVYVANQNDNTISQYTVGAGGALTAMSTATVATDTGVSAVTIDPTGTYLYATNRGTTTVSQFKIGTGGALTPMTAPTVPSGLHPTAIATGY